MGMVAQARAEGTAMTQDRAWAAFVAGCVLCALGIWLNQLWINRHRK